MRSRLSVGLICWLLLALAGPVRADTGDNFVYLLPDGSGRYRPALHGSGAALVVANIDSITAPMVSPDGSQVAFSGAVGNGSLGRYAIYVVNTDGSGLTQLTGGDLGEYDPAWSPDGDTIAFAQNTSGGLPGSACCRLATVDVSTHSVTVLTANTGVARPEFSPNGSFIVYDTPEGIWTIRPTGGAATLVAAGGFDASFSPDSTAIVYLTRVGLGTEMRRIPRGGGSPKTLITTSGQMENPYWQNGRTYTLEFSGSGYDGRRALRVLSVAQAGGGLRTEATFGTRVVGVSPGANNDEMFFYREDGLFRFYEITGDATLPSPMLQGDKYTTGWSSIASVDLDGDGNDEFFFYREDGLFRYYQIRSNATLPSPMQAGDKYTKGWSAITSVDLDGDGQDEMFFYRDDGLFRYYDIRPDGSLPPPILAGSGYSEDWSAITAIDIDGDGQDEMLFYRANGLYRYYQIKANGTLGPAVSGGSSYPQNLSSLAAIDLDGDGQDELFMYRDDGFFRYYNITSGGSLGGLILGGTDYTTGWDIITGLDLSPR